VIRDEPLADRDPRARQPGQLERDQRRLLRLLAGEEQALLAVDEPDHRLAGERLDVRDELHATAGRPLAPEAPAPG
jgi:hypothetical protein